MAKRGGSKGSIFNDSTTGSPVDHQKMTSESNKQKIAKIHDIFPTATKDQIAKILQYYEDDDNKAIDALTRDGGVEALSNLADSGSLKSKNNKNKKKKKKGRKDLDLVGSSTASFDADDSSSLHSSGNVDVEIEKECATDSRNGVLPDSGEETKEMSHERLNTPETDASSSGSKECAVSKNNLENESGACLSVTEVSKCSVSETENPICISPVSDTSDKQDDPNSKKDKYRSIKDENHGKHSSRQRTNSFRRSKTSSLSEDSVSTHNAQSAAAPTKRGYERCKKDLNRQAISLQRIYTQVDKGLEESSKKIKNSFNELRKLLDKRQEQLEQELAKTKEDALNLLKSRQDLATDLKKRVDRTPLLSEAEWTELRSDVKQFVTERKYDDELGKTIWYHWSMEPITENIEGFGEIQHVKNLYSQRSHSALSNAAVVQSNPEPSPSSSVANEEISSTADKNDVANILDAVEDETPAVKKEPVVPAPRSQPTETRATGGRVFSNSKLYGNNPHRGNRGGNRSYRGYSNYPRPNNRNNMGYRNNYHHEYTNDYRSHYNQDRDGRAHDNSMYSNDRNMNSHRNNRGDRRGPNNHYRNDNRYRGNYNRGQHHRQNNENIAKTESVVHENSAVDTEKTNVANGL